VKKIKNLIPFFSAKYLSLFKGEKLFPKQHKNIPLIPTLLHCKEFECMSTTKISQKKVNSYLNSYFTYNLEHIKNLIEKELEF
jgi:hypothetical protein